MFEFTHQWIQLSGKEIGRVAALGEAYFVRSYD